MVRMHDPVPHRTEPARAGGGSKPSVVAGAPETRPCPGCGWPIPANAAICTRCGQHVRAEGDGGGRVATKVGKPEVLDSLPPAVGSIRWRNQQTGEYSDRVPLIKCVLWMALGVGATLLLRALNPGVEDLLPYLGRFGILTALGVVLAFVARMTFVDSQASWAVFVLGVAGALAGADMAQHIVRDVIPFFALVAWPVGFIICAGIITDLLDIELTEGAFLGLALILLKLLLKWTLFEQFLAPP